MPFYPNDQNAECSICSEHFPYLYSVPGDWHAETAPGDGEAAAMPICTDCFFSHTQARVGQQQQMTCPCCGTTLPEPDVQQVVDEFSNPNQHGIPEGVAQQDVAPNLHAFAEAGAELQQAEEQQEEEEQEQEQEEEQQQQEEHEHENALN